MSDELTPTESTTSYRGEEPGTIRPDDVSGRYFSQPVRKVGGEVATKTFEQQQNITRQQELGAAIEASGIEIVIDSEGKISKMELPEHLVGAEIRSATKQIEELQREKDKLIENVSYLEKKIDDFKNGTGIFDFKNNQQTENGDSKNGREVASGNNDNLENATTINKERLTVPEGELEQIHTLREENEDIKKILSSLQEELEELKNKEGGNIKTNNDVVSTTEQSIKENTSEHIEKDGSTHSILRPHIPNDDDYFAMRALGRLIPSTYIPNDDIVVPETLTLQGNDALQTNIPNKEEELPRLEDSTLPALDIVPTPEENIELPNLDNSLPVIPNKEEEQGEALTSELNPNNQVLENETAPQPETLETKEETLEQNTLEPTESELEEVKKLEQINNLNNTLDKNANHWLDVVKRYAPVNITPERKSWGGVIPDDDRKLLEELMPLDENTFINNHIKSEDPTFSSKILRATCYDVINNETKKRLFSGPEGSTVDNKKADHRNSARDLLTSLRKLEESVSAFSKTKPEEISMSLTISDYIKKIKELIDKSSDKLESQINNPKIYYQLIDDFHLAPLSDFDKDEMLLHISKTIQKQFLSDIFNIIGQNNFDALQASAVMGDDFYSTTLKHLVPQYEKIFQESEKKVAKTFQGENL